MRDDCERPSEAEVKAREKVREQVEYIVGGQPIRPTRGYRALTCPLCVKPLGECRCDPEADEATDLEVEAILERRGLPEAWDLPEGWS